MEKIIMQRGCGKTTQLIKKSAKSGDYIVCHQLDEANRIQFDAKEMGLDIPLPITYDEFIEKCYCGRNISGFLIDNLEMFLQHLSNVPVNAVTMENLNITDRVSDNTGKDLCISDVSGTDNYTRFYIPRDKEKTNELMVVLNKTVITTNPHREMFHENNGDKQMQFVTGTLDPGTGELKLVFFVDRLKDFVSGL